MGLLKIKTFLRLSAFLVFACGSVAAVAQDEAVGRVTVLEGRADVTRGEQAAQPLTADDEIYRADILRTKSESRLEVELVDGSVIALDENTRVEVAEYLPEEGSGLLNMARGRLRATVSKTFNKRKDGFKLKTNTSVMGVQGTDFAVLASSLETTVYVFVGLVSVTSLDPDFAQAIVLSAGQFTRVRLGEPVPPPASFTPPDADGGPVVGSGSQQDVQSDGLQSNDPTVVAPQPPPVDVPPEPNPPGG